MSVLNHRTAVQTFTMHDWFKHGCSQRGYWGAATPNPQMNFFKIKDEIGVDYTMQSMYCSADSTGQFSPHRPQQSATKLVTQPNPNENSAHIHPWKLQSTLYSVLGLKTDRLSQDSPVKILAMPLSLSSLTTTTTTSL